MSVKVWLFYTKLLLHPYNKNAISGIVLGGSNTFWTVQRHYPFRCHIKLSLTNIEMKTDIFNI